VGVRDYFASKINAFILWFVQRCKPVTVIFFSSGATAPRGPRPSHCGCFANTVRHTTICMTPLSEWSARHRDLYLTTHNTNKRQTSRPPAGFEPAIPVSERPQTHALDRAATGIGVIVINYCKYIGHRLWEAWLTVRYVTVADMDTVHTEFLCEPALRRKGRTLFPSRRDGQWRITSLRGCAAQKMRGGMLESYSFFLFIKTAGTV
jgi:hypothetical protein